MTAQHLRAACGRPRRAISLCDHWDGRFRQDPCRESRALRGNGGVGDVANASGMRWISVLKAWAQASNSLMLPPYPGASCCVQSTHEDL